MTWLPGGEPGSLVSMSIARTPEPPYTAVIFTSLRTPGDHGYARMSERMVELAAQQPGFLGVESARDGVGITVSYWSDDDAAAAWKRVHEHVVAQERGKSVWYEDYEVRVATVTRAYGKPGETDV
jgi:heme-degrading monooxygenase HmoA